MVIETILKILSKLLRELADGIDSGNTNLTESEAIELVDVIKHYTDKEELISKYEACKYLNISRATFDNYVRAGKLPKGKKKIGFKELFYSKKELDEYTRQLKLQRRK